MNKFFIVLSCLSLTACMTTENTQQLGVTTLKIAANAKCTSEINNSSTWKTASKFMTAEQQQTLQTKVCGCVADKAPQSVTAVELASAAFDPNTRTQVVATAVSKTINSCLIEVLK